MSRRHETALIVALALLACSLVLNGWALQRVSGLTRDVRDLRSHVFSLGGQIGALGQRLSQPLEPPWVTGLEESFALPQSGDAGSATVTLTWILFEVDDGARVLVAVSPAGGAGDPVTEVVATSLGGLHYKAELSLDPERDWQYQIVGVVSGTRRASEVRELDLSAKLRESGLKVQAIGGTQSTRSFRAWQEPKPILDDYVIQDIRASFVTQSGTLIHVDVTPEENAWHILVNDVSPGDLFVTLVFRNGETEEAVFPPFGPSETMAIVLGG